MSLAPRKLAWRTAVAISFMVVVLVVVLAGAFGSGYFKHYHVSSEAMAPTLERSERLVAYMNGAGALRRGDIIVLRVGDATYVKRVAALPGDTFGMMNGNVLVNWELVPQRFLREERRADAGAPRNVRRLAERFPGEAAEHVILDMGPSPVDDVLPVRIPPGYVYVLGDHRDRSADSRVPRVQMGVDLLPIEDVKGRALFHAWPPAKMGARLNP